LYFCLENKIFTIMFIAIGLSQEHHFGTAFCSKAGELNLPE
jgi:hypothetical protein